MRFQRTHNGEWMDLHPTLTIARILLENWNLARHQIHFEKKYVTARTKIHITGVCQFRKPP